MAVDLQHNSDTSLSSQFHHYHDVLSHSPHHNNNNNKRSYLRALLHSTEVQKKENEEDFIAELTHNMDHFMLQDNDKFNFSCNDSELSWNLIGSPQSTLGSNQGSSKEPSTPTTPCWKSSHEEVMKLEESGAFKYHHGYETLNNKSNIDPFSHQSLIQEQIRAIELSKVKHEHVVAVKQKQSVDRESEVEISTKQSKKKEKTVGNGRRSCGPPRHAPMGEGGEGMQVIFLGGSGSTIGGTGVFFPRSGTTHVTPSQSITNKQGKGCATVLIPSRVVQALQLHFDKMSAMSRSKPGAFPPLHDVLVSVKDGIYSLQNQQSQEVPANIMQNETILPQEWTY